MNTGEGGLSDHHPAGGAEIVFQVGPGLFGVCDTQRRWDWDLFRRQAGRTAVRGFELELHQGARLRGGHVEGSKVTGEIARIRGVPAGRAIDSPNRFPMLPDTDALLDHVVRMRREGDSGATYREMADSVGLPLRSALVELDDALRRHGVRDRVRVFASGKLSSADRIVLALCLGADAVTIARGFMISVGCIQAMRCHANTCPVGVATTDEAVMRALVVDEMRSRVLNYVITLRAGLFSLAAAAGLRAPTGFAHRHAVFRDAWGRTRSGAELFPMPQAAG